jgi:hypothetical protein
MLAIHNQLFKYAIHILIWSVEYTSLIYSYIRLTVNRHIQQYRVRVMNINQSMASCGMYQRNAYVLLHARHHSQWTVNRAICVLFVIVSPLLMLGVLIYNHHRGLLQQTKHRVRYGPLYEHFKPKRYWYISSIPTRVCVWSTTRLGLGRNEPWIWYGECIGGHL